MSEPIEFTAARAGRADAVVGDHFPGASRRRVTALFSDGGVRVDGKRARKGDTVIAGARVQVAHAPVTDDELRPLADDSVAVTLAYHDAHLVVLDKAAGVPSHPLRAGELGCAANWLAARFPECVTVGDDPREAGLANRLDTGTSGLLVAARDADTWRGLRSMFATGQVDKRYLALVAGAPGNGSCEAPLSQRGKRSVIDYAGGLDAITEWTTVSTHGDYTLLECVARTGRMHQLRAHLAHVGAPIVGDARYRGPEVELAGHFLHAARVRFAHPVTGAAIDQSSPLPADRQALLDRLGRNSA